MKHYLLSQAFAALRRTGWNLFTVWLVLVTVHSPACRAQVRLRVSVVLPQAKQKVITGRVFVFVSRTSTPEPRLNAGTWYSRVEMAGTDISGAHRGSTVRFDGSELSFPRPSMRQLKPGTYYVQALLSVYTRFHRADGHTIWAHADAGEGQQLARSPGNFYSAVSAGSTRAETESDHSSTRRADPPKSPAVRHTMGQTRQDSE